MPAAASPCRKRDAEANAPGAAAPAAPPAPVPAGAAKKIRLGACAAVTTQEHAAEERSSELCLLKYEGCHGFRVAGRCVRACCAPRASARPAARAARALAVRNRTARALALRAPDSCPGPSECVRLFADGLALGTRRAGRRASSAARRSSARANGSPT